MGRLGGGGRRAPAPPPPPPPPPGLPAGGMKEQVMTMLVTNHERCECGCCRCLHVSGFMECSRCDGCIRYTWPGRDANVRLGRPHSREKAAR